MDGYPFFGNHCKDFTQCHEHFGKLPIATLRLIYGGGEYELLLSPNLSIFALFFGFSIIAIGNADQRLITLGLRGGGLKYCEIMDTPESRVLVEINTNINI